MPRAGAVIAGYTDPEKLKNIVINGDMAIAQRGTSFVAVAHATYTLDRWQYFKSGTMVHTVTQDTDVPTWLQSGHKYAYSLKIDCTTVDASIGATDVTSLGHRVEGIHYARIAGQAFTVSFWVKATKTGIYTVGVKNGASGADRSFIGEYTINASDTWEKKVIKVPAPPSTGTWSYDTGIGLNILFNLAAGTDVQATPGSWIVGNFYASVNQVNACDSTANNFWLTGVMVNAGESAAPFKLFTDSDASEYKLCERYYEKSYDPAAAPGVVSGEGAYRINIVNAGASVDANNVFTVFFKTMKRVDPTVVLWNPELLNSNGNIPYEPGATPTTPSFSNISQKGYTIVHPMGVADDDHGTYHHYTADAEL